VKNIVICIESVHVVTGYSDGGPGSPVVDMERRFGNSCFKQIDC